VITEATYTIRLGSLAREDITATTLDTIRTTKRAPPETVWDEPETYHVSSLAPEQAFITRMQPSEVAIMEELEDGCDLVELLEVTPASSALPEETAALYALKEELYLAALENFQEKLLAEGTIRFCRDDETLKELLKKPEPDTYNHHS